MTQNTLRTIAHRWQLGDALILREGYREPTRVAARWCSHDRRAQVRRAVRKSCWAHAGPGLLHRSRGISPDDRLWDQPRNAAILLVDRNLFVPGRLTTRDYGGNIPKAVDHACHSSMGSISWLMVIPSQTQMHQQFVGCNRVSCTWDEGLSLRLNIKWTCESRLVKPTVCGDGWCHDVSITLLHTDSP